jgi:hypothetical protein
MHFPVSGVDIHPLVPVGVAFVISFFASLGGLSGAFLLLPFQVSVLGFTSPAVSPTNLVFNLIATPSGVFRYFREGRMVWPLTWVIITGSIPGIFVGALLRILFFPNPRIFKFFIGCVLLYMGYRLLMHLLKGTRQLEEVETSKEDLQQSGTECEISGDKFSRLPAGAVTRTVELSLRKISYEFCGDTFSFNPIILFFLALIIGVVGGIYGIGGGAIIAPFIITFFKLPIYTIAGATLLATFATSAAGIIMYLILSYSHIHTGMAVAPDWLLGFFFGIGGLAGVYLGARTQKFVPQNPIKWGLAIVVTVLAIQYIVQFFK